MSTLDPTQADDRAAIAALVQLQRRALAPAPGSPGSPGSLGSPGAPVALDSPAWQAQLALFPEWVVRRGHGVVWSAAQQAAWERVAGLLAGELAAQPQVPMLPAGASAGPLFHDIAVLLRDTPRDRPRDTPRDEADELDLAVRWWQQARQAGLPVDGDFGECWRAIEWTGLAHHLVQIADAYRSRLEGGEAIDDARLVRLFGLVEKVALRYGGLKPLLRLLEPLSGARVTDGYTF